jgi:phage head maturation protease
VIRKSFEAVETKVLDASKGIVQALFAVTGNVDRQNDRIVAGAFSKALAAKSSVPVVYAHKWDDLDAVLGKTLNWTELMPGNPELPSDFLGKGMGGVRADVQFEMGVPAGRVAFTHVANKNIRDWSWAFDVAPEGEKSASDGVREIKAIAEIYEVTLALIGANPATTTMAFKAMVEAETHAQPDDEAELLALLQVGASLLAD